MKKTSKKLWNFEKMHKLCERWTISHEFVFILIKYKLIHFIKNSKKFDMTITIKINSNTIQSRIDIRVFDVQIDTQLRRDSHVRKIQEKMTKQIMIFTKLSIFIWKTIFRKIRMLYIFVVCSILIYDVFVWHMLKNKKSRMINKLAIIQNRCLWSIFESFQIIWSRFWKLKRTSFSSICIWISCKFRSNIAYASQTCRTSFVKNADQ
jgi:hypothetical protein